MTRLVISDTHLGSMHSMFKSDKMVEEFLRELESALKGEHLHEIILLGDIFDLWESTLPEALSISKAFLQALTRVEPEKVVYVLGNHDHHLKVLASEEDVLKVTQTEYPPLRIEGGKIITELLSQIFGPNVDIRYPSYEIDVSGHHIMLTHGHFFDMVQKIPRSVIEAANRMFKGVFSKPYTLEEVREGSQIEVEVASLSSEEKTQVFEFIVKDIQKYISGGKEEMVLDLSILEESKLVGDPYELEKYFTWIYEYLYSNTLYEGFSEGERAAWDFIAWITGKVGAVYEKIRGRPLTDIVNRILRDYKTLLPCERDPDVIVFGHTHKPELERREGKLFANSGAWLDNEGALVLIKDAKIELFKYQRKNDYSIQQIEHNEEML